MVKRGRVEGVSQTWPACAAWPQAARQASSVNSYFDGLGLVGLTAKNVQSRTAFDDPSPRRD